MIEKIIKFYRELEKEETTDLVRRSSFPFFSMENFTTHGLKNPWKNQKSSIKSLVSSPNFS